MTPQVSFNFYLLNKFNLTIVKVDSKNIKKHHAYDALYKSADKLISMSSDKMKMGWTVIILVWIKFKQVGIG